MKLIETKTLASAAASIEFTSIPQDGTDLLMLVSARTTNSAVQKITLDFNGSSANLSNRFLQGNGSVAASYAETLGMIGDASSDSNTANTFANTSAYIPNYAGSTNKSWSADSVTENNATAAFQDIIAGLWSQTAAITSLTLKLTSAANFAVGTTVSLYKITKGSDGTTVVS